MSRAEVLSANAALRAVYVCIGRMLNAAGLAANGTNNAVIGISRVALSGACIAVLTNCAVGFESYVLSAFDSSAALSTNCAVFRGRNVLANFSFGAAYVAVRITVVRVGMLGIGNAFAAVFANGAIRFQSLVAVARTNKAASVAGYVMIVIIGVRRNTLEAAAIAITNCIAIVGVSMIESGIADSGFGIVRAANRADLLFNLSLGTGRGRKSGPFVKCVLDFSDVSAFAVTIGIASVIKIMIKSRFAISGFFCAANGASSILNFSLGTGCGSLGAPLAKVMRNGSYVAAALAVTSGVTNVVVEMLHVRSYEVTIFIITLFITLEGVCVLADRIARSGFAVLAVRAVAILNLGRKAVRGSLSAPIAEYVLSIGNFCAANPAKRAIHLIGKMSGAISGVPAIVTYKVGDVIVGMRSNANESASLYVTSGVAVVIINVLDFSDVSAFAVTSGVAIVIVDMIERCNVAVSGFFSAANIANSVLNLGFGAVCGILGAPLAEVMGDNSYVITIGAVTTGIASMIKVVSENRLSGSLVFIAANVAESVKNFSRGAGCRHQSNEFIDVSVRSFSLVVALCAVTSGVAIVIENVTECSGTVNRFLKTAERTRSCNYLCGIAICRSLGFPIGEVMNVFTNGFTVVTIGIAGVVVNVIGNNAGRAANVTIGIASVIVHVILCNSQLAANVAIGIASGGILVVGNHSELTANVAGGVASVGVYVSSRNSGSGTNVTSLVASVGVHVVGYSESTAEVTVGIAIVAVNVLGSLSCFAAGVTIGVAGAIVDVRLEIRALSTADITFYSASALVSVCNGCSYLAADVTLGVAAVGKGVLGFGLAGYAVTIVTGRIARTGVHMVFAEAACKRKQHQHQGQCAKQ